MAITLDAVEEFNVAEGLQVYVLAPVTLSVVDCPVQMESSGVIVREGGGLTVTVTCCDAVQPKLSVPVIVYVVVESGVAVTFEPVEELNVDAGLHE